MKKRWIISVVILLLLGAAVYVVSIKSDHAFSAQPEGITMWVEEGSVTADGLTYTIENTLEKKICWGSKYFIEKKIFGIWIPLTFTEDMLITLPLISLEPGETSSRDAFWTSHWTPGKGSYRIVKEVWMYGEELTEDPYYLLALFEVQ
ncbi:MAG: hypothetical protein Q4C22_06350 [Bacillota bacterium]|nr:hypothetical protein [Bacillota bacterium]